MEKVGFALNPTVFPGQPAIAYVQKYNKPGFCTTRIEVRPING
ncbi:hypothetical protein [Laspinema palackyanum]